MSGWPVLFVVGHPDVHVVILPREKYLGRMFFLLPARTIFGQVGYIGIMNRIRSHIISRLLCLLVAAIILNLSVDTPDLYDDSVPEDLTYNDIETFVEWGLEVVAGIDNAIEEHDDDDDNCPVVKVEKVLELFLESPELFRTTNTLSCITDIYCNFSYQPLLSREAVEKLIQPPDYPILPFFYC
jgi:hypothetical protein